MLLSVLLANYNHGSTLRRCIDAIRAQTITNWELVIVDDGSTDGSVEIIRQLVASDDRIVPVIRETNGGAISAYREGFARLRGESFLGVAADDVLVDPTFFETALSEMTARPEIGGAFAKCRLVDAIDGRDLDVMGAAPEAGFITSAETMRAFFTGDLFIPGASAIWRMDLVRRAGFYDEELGPQCDYFLNHAIPAMSGGVVFIDRIVAAVAASTTSYSGSAPDELFLHRHALVERRLRSLPALRDIDMGLVRRWRSAVIATRFAADQQRRFFDLADEARAGAARGSVSRFPVEYLALLEEVHRRSDGLRRQLEERTSLAEAIFDDVAGPAPSLVSPMRALAEAIAATNDPERDAVFVSPALSLSIVVHAPVRDDLVCRMDGETLHATRDAAGRAVFTRDGDARGQGSWRPDIEFVDGAGWRFLEVSGEIVVDLRGMSDASTSDEALAMTNLHPVERDGDGMPSHRWTGPGLLAMVAVPIACGRPGRLEIVIASFGTNRPRDLELLLNGEAIPFTQVAKGPGAGIATLPLPPRNEMSAGLDIGIRTATTAASHADIRELGVAWARTTISYPLPTPPR